MKKESAKDLLYGGIMELINNRNNYYNSSVGSNYNHFTDQGKTAVEDFIREMATIMLRAEEESLNTRAKELVVKGLKGETI
jgi:hypothetical protein